MSPRVGNRCARWRALLPASPLERLADTLPTYRHELHFLIETTTEAKQRPQWAVEAEALVELAEHSLRDGNADRAWRSFFGAQRLELHGLRAQGRDEFRARAATLRAECQQKLRPWRRAHAEELFRAAAPREPGGHVSDAEFSAATEAAFMLHEHFGNEALKQRAGRSQTTVLVALALLALAAWLTLSFVWPLAWDQTASFGGRRLMVAVLVFGSMGASFSALISLATQSAAQTIPEQAFTYRITLARQVVGMVSALAIYVLLTTGFVKIGDFKATAQFVLLGAFAAGFSERLVVNALKKFTGGADDAKKAEGQTGSAVGRKPSGNAIL